MGFCDVVLGWDSNDQLYDNVTYTGWHTAYPDANVRILPQTCREIATEPGNLLFLCEFAGQAEALCPRGRAAAGARAGQEAMGFEVKVGFEYEFFVFAETRLLDPREGLQEPEADLARLLRLFGAAQLGAEPTGTRTCSPCARPWTWASRACTPRPAPACSRRRCASRTGSRRPTSAALFKLFTKVLAQKRDWLATFMAKWSKDWPGCGGHMHMSLWKDGKPVFFDEKAPHRMSTTMRQFVGGQQALMPELLGMVASTVNAYRRLIPGFWAPTVSAWGVENRTCALRVIPGSAKSTRVEYRIAAADANPYLALAAAVGSGLWGIENKVDPGEPVAGNSYEKKHPAKSQLPRTLMEAAGRLKASKAARDLFGDAFVDHYSATREWEEREFRKAITEWELDRYMEII